MTYPDAGTPLTILPSPAPPVSEEAAPPPPRPRPSSRLRRTNSSPSASLSRKDTSEKLDLLFTFLDAHNWTVSEMLVALSEVPTDEEGSDLRSEEHVKRMTDFLEREGRAVGKDQTPEGPDEIAKRWKDRAGAGETSDKALVSARASRSH